MPSEAIPTGTYDASYHGDLSAGARRSAACVLPRVLDLIAPASMVDFGCGAGAWLAEAAKLGVAETLGLDGPWLAPETLAIPADQVRTADLAQPVDLGRRFDLALCLEVAEHLPEAAGPVLVASLVRHAPVILFSAAIPGQGGEGHVNEAWPDRWRDLFAARGYACHDVLRAALWQEADIEPWYRQNLLLFVDAERLSHDRGLAERLAAAADAGPLALVHPEIFAARADEAARRGAEIEALREECVRLGRAWEAQAGDLAMANAATTSAQAATARAQTQIEAMRGSRSWRLTAPFRRLGALVRR